MSFQRVSADDAGQIDRVDAIRSAAVAVDDPDQFPVSRAFTEAVIRHGRDLDPDEYHLYAPDPATEPVGYVALELPSRDNRHLIWADVVVHPAARRSGHGDRLVDFVLARAAEAGRNTIWVGLPADDVGARAFAERHGFRPASADARRRQVLADLDHAALADLEARARAASADYALERLTPPIPDDLLEQMVEVTAAINDAPMGALTFEDEEFDLQRMRDIETARTRSGWRCHRIVARDTATGTVAGHTELLIRPETPEFGYQFDTAVSKAHRGHRLGIRLKLDMLHRLAEVEPQLTEIETWNNVDNHPMIDVNEAMGYRLSRTFETWQRTLDDPDQ